MDNIITKETRGKIRAMIDLSLTTQAHDSLEAITQISLIKVLEQEVGVASWVKITHETVISLQHKIYFLRKLIFNLLSVIIAFSKLFFLYSVIVISIFPHKGLTGECEYYPISNFLLELKLSQYFLKMITIIKVLFQLTKKSPSQRNCEYPN